MKNNIFVLELSAINSLTVDFLNLLSEQNIILKRNNYWIGNSNLNIYESGDREISFFNQLMYNCQIRNYSNLMIVDR